MGTPTKSPWGEEIKKAHPNMPPIDKCDNWPDCKNDATKFSEINCMKYCDDCMPTSPGYRPFTVEDYEQKCGFNE